MNFIEFIQSKGTCKTAAGHTISNLKINNEENNYPISGTIHWPDGYLMSMVWNKEGNPINLPLNHGLHLIGVVPRIEFETINIKEL